MLVSVVFFKLMPNDILSCSLKTPDGHGGRAERVGVCGGSAEI